MLPVLLSLLFAPAVLGSTQFLDRNLAYKSPFVKHPEFARDTSEIRDRHVHSRRASNQVEAHLHQDTHYPTFYGGDFSNAPYIWSGGITFSHSVASGDPFDTSVLLWTRAIPKNYATKRGPDPWLPVCVSYRIFSSSDFSKPAVHSAEAFTTYDVDFTVKVEATGLQPDTKYWYQFADCTDSKTVSPVGLTRTIASANTPAAQVNGGNPLTLAVFSCAQYQNGYFNAYGIAAQKTKADIFVHLGDYIYEEVGDGSAIGRSVDGRELATIFDYRQRLGQYRTDAALVHAHQMAPWITVWDDHEVADNVWKAGSANSNDSSAGCTFSPSGACFTDRKLAAVKAYHEWMPIRQVDTGDDRLRIWRNFQIGQLLDLTMLDTRVYDRDVTDLSYNTKYIEKLADYKNRSAMGAKQEKWLYDTLSQSQARGAVWRIVGQQIVFSQILNADNTVYDLDAWDGYKANRNRILDHLYNNKISNTILLSGDSHANWVSDIARPGDTTNYNPSTGDGAIGVEFAGTAVSSPSAFGEGISAGSANIRSQDFLKTNPNLQWSEGSYRGFFTITVDPKHLQATYYAVPDIKTPNVNAFVSAQFNVQSGANKLSRPISNGKVQAGVIKSA